MSSALQGLAAVNQAMQVGTLVPPNDRCYAPLMERGPYDGAQPESRFVVGDVRRFSDGAGADRTWLNTVLAQNAMSVLAAAGVTDARVTVAKRHNATPHAAAMVGDPASGVYTGSQYDVFTGHYQSPFTGVVSPAVNYGTVATPGRAVATFQTGTALINPFSGEPSAAGVAAGLAAVGGGGGGSRNATSQLASLAAANVNTTGASTGSTPAVFNTGCQPCAAAGAGTSLLPSCAVPGSTTGLAAIAAASTTSLVGPVTLAPVGVPTASPASCASCRGWC